MAGRTTWLLFAALGLGWGCERISDPAAYHLAKADNLMANQEIDEAAAKYALIVRKWPDSS